jgi:arginyl-tRNA synthetase
MDFKEEIIRLLSPHLQIEREMVEIPPDSKLGDYAVPCFKFAKTMKKAPAKIAEEIAGKLKANEIFSEIKNLGPYINFFLQKSSFIKTTLSQIHAEQSLYGHSSEGNGKNVVVDYSSPNIAKPFGIAHIRSTVIGHALYKIYSALGYHVIRINHLGDWGTQFGKLMAAYTKWGDKMRLDSEGIDYLVEIYIDFEDKSKKDPLLENEGRAWFKRLEDGDLEARGLWQSFRDLSLKEFKKYYDQLGIEFDHYQGEAFYNDKLESTLQYVKDHVETVMSEGALIVDLNSKGIATPLIVQKSDGASTYHTRDIAAALYRLNTYDPYKVLYVVGGQQKLHFQQLFTTLGMMGIDETKFEHVAFGTMSYEGTKMSTRLGNFIRLTEVIERCISTVLKAIEDKNPDLKDKEKVAEMVGIGAIIFGDLGNDRVKDVEFSWSKALSFEGDTGPYLQYTHARICSIKRKAAIPVKGLVDFADLQDPVEYELTKQLAGFGSQIQEAARTNKPHLIASYLLELAQLFNKFYSKCHIIGEKESVRDARLLLADSVRVVLENGLNLLGIQAPQEM